MALIPFPNIPSVPGVPSIPRQAGVSIASQSALGVLQSVLWSVFQVQSQWGIFDESGSPLGNPSDFGELANIALGTLGIGSTQSTASVEFSKEMRVSDFPIEQGGFASYNKVEMPATPTVTLCMGGSESSRSAFLAELDEACKSTDLYSVVTPEVTYINYSIDRYIYSRRSERGATLLIVELSLKEIRQVSAEYATADIKADTAKSPDSASAIDNGKVQSQAPKQSTLKKFAGRLGG